MDTIFALASGAGKAGVAIIRISGPDSVYALTSLGGHQPAPRYASLQKLADETGAPLDEALVLYFTSGASFTGQDVVELHLHGSRAIIEKTLSLLGEVDGCRMAQPGEFTRRAAEAGRLDLAQAEGLADLIDAETEVQRKLAQQLFSGALSEQVGQWRENLIEARALLEVTIDFADEDVPVDVSYDVLSLLDQVRSGLRAEIRSFDANKTVRDGFEVAIVGEPNVGKSTLLNALAGRELALTSNVAGTTRDIIEARLDIAGVPVTFLDTAGLRKTEDEIEALGVARAEQRAKSAGLRLFLVSGIEDAPDWGMQDDIVCTAKDDAGLFDNGISGKSGFGIDRVLKDISFRVSEIVSSAGLVGNQRHLAALRGALSHCDRAFEHLSRGSEGYDLASEEIRLMTSELSGILGKVDIDNVYDTIFSRFCLGK